METILTYKDMKTIISPQHPFVIIGERINPTRRKKLAESMSQGDFSVVQEDAIRQMEAGAQILDVNAGIPGGDEPVLLVGAAQAVMEVANRPLAQAARGAATHHAVIDRREIGHRCGSVQAEQLAGHDRIVRRGIWWCPVRRWVPPRRTCEVCKFERS